MAGVGQVAIVQRQVLEPRIGGLDEDLRLVSGRAQHALDAQHLVTDGIAVAKGREHLMDGEAPCVSAAPPPPPPAAAGARRFGRRRRRIAAASLRPLPVAARGLP